MSNEQIASTGETCSIENLKIVIEAEKKAEQFSKDVYAKANSVATALENLVSGKSPVIDTVKALAMDQAGAMAAVAADQISEATTSALSSALEAMFSTIFEIVIAGPLSILSLMQKPAERAINYADQEREYLRKAKINFNRIMTAMIELFDIGGLAPYIEKMQKALEHMNNSLNYFSNLMATMESQNFFNERIYNRAVNELNLAIDAIQIETKLSKVVKKRLEDGINEKNKETEKDRQEEIRNIKREIRTKISDANADFNTEILAINNFFIPILEEGYSKLLKEKNQTASQYFNTIVAKDKQSRLNEAAENSIPGAGVYSSYVALGEKVGHKEYKDSFTHDLSGMVRAINDAEATKNDKIASARLRSHNDQKKTNVSYDVEKSNNTVLAYQEFAKETGKDEVIDMIKEAYLDDKMMAIEIIKEEFGKLANNTSNAFRYYKKRHMATKGTVRVISGLMEALELFERMLKKSSDAAANVVILGLKNAVVKLIGQSHDLAEEDLRNVGKITKFKLSTDCTVIYGKLKTAESSLAGIITDSLIDILNAGKMLEEITDQVNEIVSLIEQIPDWDGGIGDKGWIYSDKKDNPPNSPYIGATRNISSLSISAPRKIMEGENGKIEVRRSMRFTNSLFIKLMRHNSDSTEILKSLDFQENPYMNKLMAKLESLGLDMVLDLLEAGELASSIYNMSKGVATYVSAQLECADKQEDRSEVDIDYLNKENTAKAENEKGQDLTTSVNRETKKVEEHYESGAKALTEEEIMEEWAGLDTSPIDQSKT